MYFPALTITNAGRDLFTDALANNRSLVFSGFKLGNSQSAPASILSLTDVISSQITFGISRFSVNSVWTKAISLSGGFDNADVEADFYATELGVYAKDPTTNNDVLFAYAYNGESPALIAANDAANYYRTAFTIDLAFGQTAMLTAVINASDEYALEDDLDDHITDKSNPHEVTYSQVGAASSTAFTNHTTANNPHGITPSMIGAAAVVYGNYAGDGTSLREINLGFKPSAVFVFANDGKVNDGTNYYGGMATRESGVWYQGTIPSMSTIAQFLVLTVSDNGFTVNYYASNNIYTNKQGSSYAYLAFK